MIDDPSRLGTRTSAELNNLTGPVLLLVPLGSTEQHGPHLPLDTDTRIALALANAVAHRNRAATCPVLVTPALPVGASGEHQGFAGTLSIGHDALQMVLVELARSVQDRQWAGGLVFVNGHGGNLSGLTRAVNQLTDEGHLVHSWSPRVPDGDAHAGHTETSLMLHLAPELVRVERAEAGRTESVSELASDLRTTGVAGVSPNGVLGDPTSASAAAGEDLFASLVTSLNDTVEQALAELGSAGHNG